MRRIKMQLDDLLLTLESMRESGGTTQVIIFEYEGMPAICDAEDPDNIIAFTPEEYDDEEQLH